MTSVEKQFYDRHLTKVGERTIGPEQRAAEIRTPGDRYFCVTDFIRDPQNLTAVEWGFGDVARCMVLAGLFKSFHAIDISAAALVGGAKLPFEFSECDLNQDLPFPDQSFDVSIAMMVIEHLFDPFHSFSEISRTTKKGGYVFVNLPLISSFKSRLALLTGKMPVTSSGAWWDNEEWDGGHLHNFTIDLVTKVAKKYRLDLARTYPVGSYLGLKRLWPALFYHELSFVFVKR